MPDLSPTRNCAELPSALAASEEIWAEGGRGSQALFLDYDGTLTPIVARPEMAVLSESMRRTVAALSAILPVAIISGRDLENVKALVNLDGLTYAGSHGFDVDIPGKGRSQPHAAEEYLPLLDRAESGLAAELAGIAGARIERKAFTIAVHYRQVADVRAADVEKAVDTVIATAEGLRKKGGKKVFEVQPDADWDKGKAVLWLLDKMGWGRDGSYPIYIGDDLTDEDAFRALTGRGAAIIVRDDDRPTAAAYALESTAETELFLARLLALAGG